MDVLWRAAAREGAGDQHAESNTQDWKLHHDDLLMVNMFSNILLGGIARIDFLSSHFSRPAPREWVRLFGQRS